MSNINTIDPEKLLSLRSVWLEASRNSQEAFERATEASRAAGDAESDFIAYARGGDDELQAEQARRDQLARYGLSQGAGAVIGGLSNERQVFRAGMAQNRIKP